MLSQKSPIPSPPHTLPYPPTPNFWPWHSPAYKVCKSNGLLFPLMATRPSFDTYADRDKSSGILASS